MLPNSLFKTLMNPTCITPRYQKAQNKAKETPTLPRALMLRESLNAAIKLRSPTRGPPAIRSWGRVKIRGLIYALCYLNPFAFCNCSHASQLAHKQVNPSSIRKVISWSKLTTNFLASGWTKFLNAWVQHVSSYAHEKTTDEYLPAYSTARKVVPSSWVHFGKSCLPAPVQVVCSNLWGLRLWFPPGPSKVVW